jgi:hypothetical protein
MHIPKSGGSSIHTALEAALPPKSLAPQRFDTSPFCDFDDFHLLSPEARSRIVTNPEEVRSLGQYRAVSGHFSLPTLLQVADAPSISTVLREPRTRLISLYMYWRTPELSGPMAPYAADAHAQRPFWEFLSEPLLAPAIDNQICRMLLYGDSRLPKSVFAALPDIESIAADAISQLDTLGFVGILDSGQDLWEGLRRLFGAELRPVKLNLAGEYGDPRATKLGEKLLTQEALDLIERRNMADLLVYDHALARIESDATTRRWQRDSAFAHQLVELGDRVGHSAARVSEQAGVVAALRTRAEERERSHAEPDEIRNRLSMQEQTIHDLNETIGRRDRELEKLHQWLDAVHASASWRITAPLRAVKHGVRRSPSTGEPHISARDQSLLPGWSAGQVWAIALVLTLLIAVTDAILTNRVIIIALLVVGPLCGLLTGRWVKTATSGIWSVSLAVVLGFPDEIWGTRTQMIDVGAVVIVSVVSAWAATVIEKRQACGHSVRVTLD